MGIHLIVPGMALTGLLMGNGERDCRNRPPELRRIFNILAEPPEIMGEWMSSQVQRLHGTGTYVSYLSPLNVAWRFARARFMRNRLVDEQTGALLFTSTVSDDTHLKDQ